MSNEWTEYEYEYYRYAPERKFSVNGTVYTLYEYGDIKLNELYKDLKDEVINPEHLSRDDIEEWALKQLELNMKEIGQEIYEIKSF